MFNRIPVEEFIWGHNNDNDGDHPTSNLVISYLRESLGICNQEESKTLVLCT